MIKNIVKRKGNVEPYIPSKLNAWGRWAASTIGNKVDWSSIVINAVSTMPETVTSAQLQEKLIQNCLDKETWSYYLMAGRLYAAHLQKTIHEGKIPTVKELHETLNEVGLMVRLDYDTLEYQEIESIIDHEKDFQTPHFALHYIRRKYSLQNRTTGQEYETQQFVYMRMAMALAEKEPRNIRIQMVKRYYDAFSNKLMSAPTPNYVNLGTKSKGFVSCNLYYAKDTIESLAAGDHIAYMMSASSAGIGGFINSRSKGDPVRAGQIEHQGRLPLYALLGKAVKATLQNSRGGACTTYYSAYDPEAETIAYLRNPRSTEDKKNRDLHYAMETNKFFAEKVARNENIFKFNIYTAPKLMELFFSSDYDGFKAEYERLEANPSFKKEYTNARDLILIWLNEALETGVAYLANIDEMNRHTPFKDTIHSSNLCVAPYTPLLTDKGEFPIIDLAGQTVNVWNGKKFTPAKVEQTNTNQKLIRITVSNGNYTKSLDNTIYHKWYINRTYENGKKEYGVEARAYELMVGTEITDYELPDGSNITDLKVISIDPVEGFHDTYCVNEPTEHKAIFNGILTSQCLEISEPTEAYDSMTDLYSNKTVGYVKIRQYNGVEETIDWNKKLYLIDSSMIYAGKLKVGDKFKLEIQNTQYYTVEEILESKPEPEVALCALGSIPYDHIDENDDETYQEVMYLTLKMIDYCILNMDYRLPHIGVTAKARMNAGIGILGVAAHMAEKHLKYDTKEGLEEIHRIAERHMYHAIKASLRIARERGNAPWIHKTKWVEGWLPIDTYKRSVDDLGDFKYRYDWEALREEIKEQGGIAHSCLVAHMPNESSSKAINTANGIYPIRDKTLNKTDGFITIRWAAPNSDDPSYEYQSAWDINEVDMIKVYSVFQKFTDQAISADLWRRIKDDSKVSSKELLTQYLTMVKYGMKTRYYYNSNVSNERSLDVSGSISDINETDEPADGYCEGCSM